jgi:hypothetical protein
VLEPRKCFRRGLEPRLEQRLECAVARVAAREHGRRGVEVLIGERDDLEPAHYGIER